MVEHSFNIEIAQSYGVLAAILYRHFQYWIAKNLTNRTNFCDGRTWTYNSLRALADQFPYLSVWDIRRAVKLLVDGGILLKGNYNKHGYDRTIWYAFADEKVALRGLPSYLWDSQMEGQKSTSAFVNPTNADGKTHTTIPNPIPNKLLPEDKPNPIVLKSSSLGISELDLRLVEAKKFFMGEIGKIFRPNQRESITFARITKHLVNLVQAGERDLGIFKDAIEWARQAKASTARSKKALFVAAVKKKTGFKRQERLLKNT